MSVHAAKERRTRRLVVGLENLKRDSAEDEELKFLSYLISMAEYQAKLEERKLYMGSDDSKMSAKPI